ncbi:MAG: TonB-dependent receptor [Acetobacteraceae bacterium]
MVEGDFYRNTDAFNGRQYGSNIVGRWSRRFDDDSHLEVQTSFDEQSRVAPGTTDWYASYDLQAQHTFAIGRNTVVWGGEYRVSVDHFEVTVPPFALVKPRRLIGIGDVFVEDTITITDRLKLTAGLKLEDSTYTGFDYLPSVRWAGAPRIPRSCGRPSRARCARPRASTGSCRRPASCCRHSTSRPKS